MAHRMTIEIVAQAAGHPEMIGAGPPARTAAKRRVVMAADPPGRMHAATAGPAHLAEAPHKAIPVAGPVVTIARTPVAEPAVMIARTPVAAHRVVTAVAIDKTPAADPAVMIARTPVAAHRVVTAEAIPAAIALVPTPAIRASVRSRVALQAVQASRRRASLPRISLRRRPR